MDLQPVWDWFRVLHATTGIKLTIFYDAFDRARFFNGFLTSIRLMALCLVCSVAIGVVGAWVQKSRLSLLRAATEVYIQFFRNTPPLVQLYFFFFALGAYLRLTNAAGLEVPVVSNFVWAVICLSLYAGAFNIEIFAPVSKRCRETVEAVEALGYSRLKAYAYVVLPLAFRISLPALNNNLVNLVKTTTIAYAIAVPEMLYVANQIWSDELNVGEMMNVLLVI
jgi:polar amino acid transport system permease protein